VRAAITRVGLAASMNRSGRGKTDERGGCGTWEQNLGKRHKISRRRGIWAKGSARFGYRCGVARDLDTSAGFGFSESNLIFDKGQR
jgi:hypothetical protein